MSRCSSCLGVHRVQVFIVSRCSSCPGVHRVQVFIVSRCSSCLGITLNMRNFVNKIRLVYENESLTLPALQWMATMLRSSFTSQLSTSSQKDWMSSSCGGWWSSNANFITRCLNLDGSYLRSEHLQHSHMVYSSCVRPGVTSTVRVTSKRRLPVPLNN